MDRRIHVAVFWACALLLIFLSNPMSARAAAATIGFELPYSQPPGTHYEVHTYSEAGFEFLDGSMSSLSSGLGRAGPGSEKASNGTSTLDVLLGAELVFRRVDLQPFQLLSIDLAEYGTGYPEPWTIVLIGDRVDGSTVYAAFTTDGLVHGFDSLVDFQTFVLPDSFSDLVRVYSADYRYALDNVIVESVPEPAHLALAGLAAVALGHAARRGSRRRGGFSG